MRTLLLGSVSFVVLAACAYLGGQSGADTVEVRLKLVDGATGKAVGGIVRFFPRGKDEPLALPGLFDRLRGLKPSKGAGGWYVVPEKGARITLPRASLRVEALSGLETALARQEIDLRAGAAEVVVKLDFLFRPEDEKLVAGNTHLHLRALTKEGADE